MRIEVTISDEADQHASKRNQNLSYEIAIERNCCNNCKSSHQEVERRKYDQSPLPEIEFLRQLAILRLHRILSEIFELDQQENTDDQRHRAANDHKYNREDRVDNLTLRVVSQVNDIYERAHAQH